MQADSSFLACTPHSQVVFSGELLGPAHSASLHAFWRMDKPIRSGQVQRKGPKNTSSWVRGEKGVQGYY